MLPLVMALLVAVEPGSPEPKDGDMIRRFCLVAFDAAMRQADQTPPEGMAAFTCDCFLDQVKAGASIDAARLRCTEEAAQRYPV